MRVLWIGIAEAIGAAHHRRIILGDLSFTNILVQESESIRIIDLEASVEEGVDAEVGLSTPGVSGIRAMSSELSDFADDYASLGAIIFGSIMLVLGITGFYPPARSRFLS